MIVRSSNGLDVLLHNGRWALLPLSMSLTKTIARSAARTTVTAGEGDATEDRTDVDDQAVIVATQVWQYRTGARQSHGDGSRRMTEGRAQPPELALGSPQRNWIATLAAVIAGPRLGASSKGPLLSLSVPWRLGRSGWAGSIENCVGWHNHPRFIKWFVE